jgi:uncharacterized protein YndB with AHSA1/START domain
MSTPDVPLRMALTFPLPGPPEQLWDAIATANGISAWFLPTDMEEREGGAICFHMGEDDSPGTVTDFDAPHRLVYEEPNWAALTGHEPTSVTPLVTEFLLEAKSGGTCVLRVVSSAFGTGADWEQEFFEEMERMWTPFFDNLRLYLTHFPGQRVTSLYVNADVPGAADTVWSALRQALGATDVGQTVEARGVTGRVERIGAPPGPNELLVRVTDPVPGFLGFAALDKGDGGTSALVQGYLFSEDARAFVEREQPQWKAWLQSLPVPAA